MIKRSVEKIGRGEFDECSLNSAKKTLIYQYMILSDKKTSITDNALLNAMIQDTRATDDMIKEIKDTGKNDIEGAFSQVIPDTAYILEAE